MTPIMIGNADHDAEPDRIVAQLDDCRIKDRCCKDHEREVIDEGARQAGR